MDKFPDGAPVRLRSRSCDLLLHADEDGVGVSLSSLRSSPRTSWMVRHVERDGAAYVLLRSAPDGHYLSVSADAAPPGALGIRAVQSEAVGAVWSVRSAGDGGRDVLVSHSVHGLLCPQGSAARVRQRVNARSLQPRWSVEIAPVAAPPRVIPTSPVKEDASRTPPIALPNREASGGRENTVEEPPSHGKGLSASAVPFWPMLPAPYGWPLQPELDMAPPMTPWQGLFYNAPTPQQQEPIGHLTLPWETHSIYSSAAPPWVPAPVPAPLVQTEQPNSSNWHRSSSQPEYRTQDQGGFLLPMGQQQGTPSVHGPGETQIHDVWAANATTAFAAVEELLGRRGKIIVGIDSEFAVPDGAAISDGEPGTPELHYRQLLNMVNGGDLIQIGLAVADGELKTLGVFQFNLRFSATWRESGHPGVAFLRDTAGLDMQRHASQGILADQFINWFATSGLICNENITWLSFMGYTDFGFLTRYLTQAFLPEDCQQFLNKFWELFPVS